MTNDQHSWHETVAQARAQPPSAAVAAAIAELRACITRLSLLNVAATGAAGPIPAPVAEIIRDSIQGVNRMQQVVDDLLADVERRLRAAEQAGRSAGDAAG